MKEKALIYLSLAFSIAAFGDAIWVHEHAEQIAAQALQNREREFAQKFAPKVRELYEGMGVTNTVVNPTNLDQLFGPMLETLNQISGPVTNDEEEGLSQSTEQKWTEFAASYKPKDLTLLRDRLQTEHFECSAPVRDAGAAAFSVKHNDFNRARMAAVKIIRENSLTVILEIDAGGNGTEQWKDGKKVGETYF